MTQLSPVALSSPPETASPLAEGVVELWAVDPAKLRSARLLRTFADWLTPEEDARRRRFIVARDRHAYVVCRGLVRQVLSWHTGIEPGRLCFETNRHGRPELASAAGPPPLRFNLARTRGLAVLAVTRSRPVGVDVENTFNGHIEEVALLAFSELELAAIRTTPTAARNAASYQLWTLKEAYLKARGFGLSAAMDAVEFEIGGESSVRARFGEELGDRAEAWQFNSLRPTPKHRVALAINRGSRPDFQIAWRGFPG